MCKSFSELDCCNRVKSSFDEDQSNIKNCSLYCPTPCRYQNYFTSLSFADYPTSYYANILKNEPTILNNIKDYSTTTKNLIVNKSFLSDSVAKLNVYYNKMSYEQIDERPAVSGDSLFGTVGNYSMNKSI